MGQPIATKESGGMCIAFPDVCLTPMPVVGTVPIPYPNLRNTGDTTSTSTTVKIKGKEIILESSEIPSSTGDEAGVSGGVMSGKTMGKVTFTTYSSKVRVEGKGVVRLGDTTQQNENNAVGTVLYGEATVMGG